MTIYTPPRIKNARENISRKYEQQVGHLAPMLPDILAILTSPGIMPLLKELIEAVEETDRSFDNEAINPTPRSDQGSRDGNWVTKGPGRLY